MKLNQLIAVIALGSSGPFMAGCAQTSYLSFDMSSPLIAGSYRTVVNDLNSGAVSVNDPRFTSGHCEFAVDFVNHSATIANVTASGSPNTSGFNVVYSASRLNGRAPCSLPRSIPPTDINITSGRNIAIGQPNRSGVITLAFGNNEVFSSRNGFMEFKLESFNTSTHYATGSFSFVGRNRDSTGDSRVVWVTNGRFGAPIR